MLGYGDKALGYQGGEKFFPSMDIEGGKFFPLGYRGSIRRWWKSTGGKNGKKVVEIHGWKKREKTP